MDEPRNKQWIVERLKHSLQALALPASAQLLLFPDFVVKTDELVLDFHHWRECALSNYRDGMTTTQLESLAALDAHFANLTECTAWTEGDLSAHPFWAEARRLAVQALNAFGWLQETPPSYAQEYVPGRVND